MSTQCKLYILFSQTPIYIVVQNNSVFSLSLSLCRTKKKKSERRNIDKQVGQARPEGSKKEKLVLHLLEKSHKGGEKGSDDDNIIMTVKLIVVMCKTNPKSINEFYSVIFFFPV